MKQELSTSKNCVSVYLDPEDFVFIKSIAMINEESCSSAIRDIVHEWVIEARERQESNKERRRKYYRNNGWAGL